MFEAQIISCNLIFFNFLVLFSKSTITLNFWSIPHRTWYQRYKSISKGQSPFSSSLFLFCSRIFFWKENKKIKNWKISVNKEKLIEMKRETKKRIIVTLPLRGCLVGNANTKWRCLQLHLLQVNGFHYLVMSAVAKVCNYSYNHLYTYSNYSYKQSA